MIFLVQICRSSAATFSVTNLTDSGAGSLRQAILNANTNPGPSSITFNLTGAGPFTLTPASAYAVLTNPVTIDATTLTNYAGTPLVELRGTVAGAGAYGLHLAGGGSTVRGLSITRFDGAGVCLASSGNVIEGSYIGFMTSSNQGNGVGVLLQGGAAYNRIGGTGTPARNVISGNNSDAIQINGAEAGSNLVQGNFIGTHPSGSLTLKNGGDGVAILDAPGNVIGGITAGAGNLISGNNRGVFLNGSGARFNRVEGNLVGTDVSGLLELKNELTCIVLQDAPYNVIGGTVAGARNVISGSKGSGLYLRGNGTTNILIQGNFIGADAAGGLGLGNKLYGVRVEGGANNVVGGTNEGAGNFIADNKYSGVLVDGGQCAVLGNSIHTNGGGITLLNGANNNAGAPVLTSATNNLGGTQFRGTLSSTPGTIFRIEFFASPSINDAKQYLGSSSVTTDGAGLGSVDKVLTTGTITNQFVVATATDPFGNTSEFSTSRAVVFHGRPLITTGPQSLAGASGSATLLVIDASGTPAVTYRWFLNGVLLPTATNASLVFSPLAFGDAGSYTVVVSNSLGVLTSTVPAVLTVLGGIADQTGYVLRRLLVTNVVTDPGQPANRWTHRLADGAPAGARISTNRGIFYWVPARDQAPATNLIEIVATDDSVPPVSATNAFQVFVTDYLALELGQTVLRAGDTSNVPVTTFASAAVTNVTFILEASETRLTNLWVESLLPAVAPGSLQSAGTGRYALTFEALSGQSLVGTQTLARLHFLAVTNEGSAFVPLTLSSVTATQSTGAFMPRLLGYSGRAAVVEEESLVELLAEGNDRHTLILYGKVGTNYTVEGTASLLAPATWTLLWQVTLTNLSQAFPGLTNTGAAGFYRAYE